MYRREDWQEGYYMDTMIKYECHDCGKTFIVGEDMLKECPPGYPVCPYCGQSNVEWTAMANEETAEEDCEVLGCLALYVDMTCTLDLKEERMSKEIDVINNPKSILKRLVCKHEY